VRRGAPSRGRRRQLPAAGDHRGAASEERKAMGSGFGDILAERVAERESQIVLGLDPDPQALWPGMHDAAHGHRADASPAWRTAVAVHVHCCAVIDAAGPACVAIKPQLACFERLGAPGWEALGEVADHARRRGLLVIADGKRGDVPVTANVYGEALFGAPPPAGAAPSGQTAHAGGPRPHLRPHFGGIGERGVDMATVNPLLGRDALEPFVAAARMAGAGVLVLVRTSNPGAADVQDLQLAATGHRPAGTVWERLAAIVEELGAAGVGDAGLSDVGAVMGATEPRHLTRARELMPRAVLLLPGVGAQGGRVEELAAAFAPGRAGGLITASRSIAGAHLLTGGDPAGCARAEAERLRTAAWALGG
jgi:orotidine-5'-phosphate decarboxylase